MIGQTFKKINQILFLLNINDSQLVQVLSSWAIFFRLMISGTPDRPVANGLRAASVTERPRIAMARIKVEEKVKCRMIAWVGLFIL
jgi:hypothetical protein